MWHLSDDGDVIAEINRCSEQVKADFCELLDHLVRDPRDVRLGVLPLADLSWPGDGYTAAFADGAGLLFYSLTRDMPIIRLQAVVWRP